jgi:hypothetical protein
MSDITLAHIASPDVIARARKIKLFLMDVDGTLTDGGVCLISSTSADGSGSSAVSEMKVFNAHDGQGLSLAHTMGQDLGDSDFTCRTAPFRPVCLTSAGTKFDGHPKGWLPFNPTDTRQTAEQIARVLPMLSRGRQAIRTRSSLIK